jgi:phosphoserine phosphatase RsbU/P
MSLAQTSPALQIQTLDSTLDGLQSEISQLQQEVDMLRRRDDALNLYMHRMDEEMRLAARLQRDFLPKKLPEVGPVRFHTLYRPAGFVSGDLYDVMRLDETHVGFYMADAVGHGLPAALLTMFIKNALVTKQIGANGYQILPPSAAMARLNEALLSANLSNATFATALYGWINTATGEVQFARGGHPNPVLLRGDGSLLTLEADGPLLGIFPDETFTDGTVRMQSGDRLLLFTDGVEVAFSEGENIDPTRWLAELNARRHFPAAALLQEFANHLDREGGSITPKDDLTVVAVEMM